MRRLGQLGLLLLSSGCSFLLDESPGAPTDAQPAVDAAPELDAPAPPCDDVMEVQAILLADTIIADGGATGANFNNAPNMTIGDQLASVGLVLFDLPSLPVAAQVVDATLRLPHAPLSDLCGTPDCSSCDTITRDGSLEIFVGRNDWTPADVSWDSRGDGPWEIDGAMGDADRLAALGTADYTANQDLSFTFEPPDSELDLSGQLTLVLDATAQGKDENTWTKLVVSTQENDCSGVRVPALEIRFCP